jgi:glycosyltransferase involved in cell wall biosynthesis
MRAFEAGAARRADTCSLVSGADRAAPGLERAAVIPLGVDLERLPFREPAERPPELLFFGNLGYFHNVEPARYVAREVLPRVREAVPDATLRIVGARPGPAVRRLAALDRVEVVGAVPEMAPELHRAAVAVLPMFTGSGLKTKVLEAFCAGTPVVTNALGILGLEGADAGRHYLAAESPDEAAAACLRLLENAPERVRLAGEASRLVRERYTWEAAVEALRRLYHGQRR